MAASMAKLVMASAAVLLVLGLFNGVAGFQLTLYSEANYGGDNCAYFSGGALSPGFAVQSYDFKDSGNLCLFALCNGSNPVGSIHISYQDPNGGGFDNVRIGCGEITLQCDDGVDPQETCP